MSEVELDLSTPACVAGLNLINGQWVEGQGESYTRESPNESGPSWKGNWADQQQALEAIANARTAFADWSEAKLDERIEVCRKFASIVTDKSDELAKLIAAETGKPFWEARTEVAASIAKVENSIDSIMKRRWTTTQELGDFLAVTRFRPHGVMFVIGPFNFPSHVPGGHIIPALLAGNTVIFKPSELVSGVGQWLTDVWLEAGIPAGVFQLIHGGGEIAQQVSGHDDVDGVLFTGSARVGQLLHKQMAGQPHKVLALELGGNNPLVVHNCSDLRGAAITTILSAYLTSGQRCTCTRRLIVTGKSAYDELLDLLRELIPQIDVGLALDVDQPFMGPLIHDKAAQQMLQSQEELLNAGAKSEVKMESDSRAKALLRPGLISVAADQIIDDCEHFGPLLMAFQAESIDEAIAKTNATKFGLSAGFIGDEVDDFYYFLHRIRAGVVNWNRQTTGASGKLPFGGVGLSGNHQPSGYFAADYCSYPVASLESHELSDARKAVPGLPFIT